MDLAVADVIEASKLIAELEESVTCLECCKYYRSPETAPCGHMLCHICWRWQRSCPTCEAPLDKNKLRSNIVIQNLTKHICSFRKKFEKVIKKNLDEFLLEIKSYTNPTENDNNWLTSSQNHSSAPSSQPSIRKPKIRKEYSKLNKIERKNLNVSIEMFKKAQRTKKKNFFTVGDNSNNSSSMTNNDNIEIDNKINNINIVEEDNRTEQSTNEVLKVANINDKNNSIHGNQCDVSSPKNINEEISYSHNCFKAKTPFLKKSPLDNIFNVTVVSEKTNNEVSSVNNATSNSDDISSAIIIGNKMANIPITKNQNNVQVKENTDQETKTSFDQNLLKDVSVTMSSNNVSTQTSTINKEIIKNHKIKQVQNILDKFVSTKKLTAWADTTDTETVEKELSSIIECGITNDAEYFQPQQQAIIGGRTNVDMCTTNQRTDYLNDLDIFEYGSVKEKISSEETELQLLKNTEKASSEIIISSIKRSKHKPLKIAQKGNRDIIVTSHELPPSKKQKTSNTREDLVQEIEQDREPSNYDAIVGQMFAIIDSDIEDIEQSQISNKNINILKQKSYTGYDSDDVFSNTQCINTMKYNSSETQANKYKYSENVFSISSKENESHCWYLVTEEKNTDKETNETPVQIEINNTSTPNTPIEVIEEHADVASADVDFCTPMLDEDSDMSAVEVTPQKNSSFTKLIPNYDAKSKTTEKLNATTEDLGETKSSDSSLEIEIINITDPMDESKDTEETNVNINEFVDQIQHKSTPVARKSSFYSDIDPDYTLCSTTSKLVNTTQEKECMTKAFKQTPQSQVRQPLAVKKVRSEEKLCIAGSCLSAAKVACIKALCKARGWTYSDQYVEELTHLVVSVDEENKSQRSLKYMCALAAGKWIVNYTWIYNCFQSKNIPNEEPYEVLDWTGDPSPRLSRTAQKKLFEGISFFCMPPFTQLDIETLKEMLEAAGGTTLSSVKAARVTAGCPRPALLLAEPEKTQERFIYMAIELNIVPLNYEWVLDSLGSYNLQSIREFLLCPSVLLPAATSQWPEYLLAIDSESN